MKFTELFETQIVMEFGGDHKAPGRGAGAFSQGAYQQMAGWLGGIEDHDVRMFIANMAADVYENDSSKFKRELFIRKVSEGSRYRSKFRWQQRHYWAFTNAIKELPNQNMRDYIGRWLGDNFEEERNNSENYYGFRRNLWDSACGIEGANPAVAKNPHSRKHRDDE